MTASRTGPTVFNDNVSWMNYEVYKAILFVPIQTNAEAMQEFLKTKKLDILSCLSQSPDFTPVEHAFHLLHTKLYVKWLVFDL